MKKVLLLSLALILLLGIMSHGTSGYFSDTETSAVNTFTAWVEICEPVSIVIVSDTETEITGGNVSGASYPYDAVLAWVHGNWANIDHTFPAEAEWIWESQYVVNPVDGDIVTFERIVTIPDNIIAGTLQGTLYITCDNGYEVWLNDDFVGSAQLGTGWGPGNLTETYCQSQGWQSVESWDISSWLGTSDNTFVIYGVNEQMDNGTTTTNPGGLIFEIRISYRLCT